VQQRQAFVSATMNHAQGGVQQQYCQQISKVYFYAHCTCWVLRNECQEYMHKLKHVSTAEGTVMQQNYAELRKMSVI
jgi:hypothetical protein